MHAFKFMVSAGAWAEELHGLPDSASKLAELLKATSLVKTWANGTPVTVRYQSCSLDARPDRRGKYVEVGYTRFTDPNQLDAYAARCWQRAVNDYHQGLGFPCACLPCPVCFDMSDSGGKQHTRKGDCLCAPK